VDQPARRHDHYDALLLVSFGGPEKREDVIPFLENVLRGRNVPRERLLAVAEHYYHFDGVSPINGQCRDLIAALQPKVNLPIYWGNRNWQPMLMDTVREMRDRGVTRALALATSAFGSYSGCRQYREDIAAACTAVAAEGADAPKIDKIPPFWWDRCFIEGMVERLKDAMERLPDADIIFTAHSIPEAMAEASPYVRQLREAAQLIQGRLHLKGDPALVFQSRSGPPTQPWLEPDISSYLKNTDSKRLIVVPLGFLSDHMEVVYDLDTELAGQARELGIEMFRAGTVGTHPVFVNLLAQMINELTERGVRECDPNCCAPAVRQVGVRQVAVRPTPAL
jgi:ferrochelatase